MVPEKTNKCELWTVDGLMADRCTDVKFWSFRRDELIKSDFQKFEIVDLADSCENKVDSICIWDSSVGNTYGIMFVLV